MYNAEVISPIVACVSAGSGIAVGLLAVRYFRAETSAQRLIVFWPTFWLVGLAAFVVCMAVVALISDPS